MLNMKTLTLMRKQKKYIDLFLDIAPESKKSMGRNQAEIQKMIIAQMKERHFRKIESKIAIEIIAYTSERSPPRIERFVKNLLDLMHKKEILEDANDSEFLPFKEDRDIKFLSVRYIFLPGKSQTFVHIRPFSCFIGDLHFINAEIEEDESDRDDPISIKEHHEDLMNHKEDYIELLSEKAYESMLDLSMLDMQKDLSSYMAVSPFMVRLIYPKKGTKPAFIRDTYREWAEELLDFPIRIRLPELPTEQNTSKAYRAEVKSQLSSYLGKRPVLENLKAPAIVTVFYSPPYGKRGFYKDIDNIVLEYILPTFNDIFAPPISLLNLNMGKKDGASTAIPKSLNGSAIGYVILELPKKYSKQRGGFLSVGFEVVDSDREGLIQSIDRKLKSYMRNH